MNAHGSLAGDKRRLVEFVDRLSRFREVRETYDVLTKAGASPGESKLFIGKLFLIVMEEENPIGAFKQLLRSAVELGLMPREVAEIQTFNVVRSDDGKYGLIPRGLPRH